MTKLDRVPETLLWTLYHRSIEARRPDAVLTDPLAVELVDRIDFPFAERFGGGEEFSQWQGLRSRCFDLAVGRFLEQHPDGEVVALGEGLETQFWRLDNGRVRWLTVDLPEVVELRRSLLPHEPRMRTVGSSVLDQGWLEAVDASSGVLVTAEGLLMYLSAPDARGLVARCSERFAGSSIVFDVVPRWLAERSRQGKLTAPGGYRPPPWSWGFDANEERALRALPRVDRLRALRPPRGRGAVYGALLPAAGRVPPLRRLLLSVMEARFSS